jgi:hypothetical protein
MLKHLSGLTLVTICLLLVACSNSITPFQTTHTELPVSHEMTEKSDTFPAFHSVAVNGPFDVHIYEDDTDKQSHTSRINIQGSPELLQAINYCVNDDTLKVYMNTKNTYNPRTRARVNISMSALKRLSAQGNSTVNIAKIYTPHLRVIASGNAQVILAGYAQRFDATFTDNSRLNAKCLYTKTIFINTTGTAQAEILNNKGGIGALAANNSDIYYYAAPDLVAPYQRESGSIMRMRGIAEASLSQKTQTVSNEQIVQARG